MNKNKLEKVKRELRAIRTNPQGRRAEELISLARQLGRVIDPRGKEPTYVRERDPALSPPLSIPNHGGRDMKIGTVRSIVDQLLDDADEWSIHLNEEDAED